MQKISKPVLKIKKTLMLRKIIYSSLNILDFATTIFVYKLNYLTLHLFSDFLGPNGFCYNIYLLINICGLSILEVIFIYIYYIVIYTSHGLLCSSFHFFFNSYILMAWHYLPIYICNYFISKDIFIYIRYIAIYTFYSLSSSFFHFLLFFVLVA